MSDNLVAPMTGSRRLVCDLQACQTAGSAMRGVGRYSKSLFEAILQNRGMWDVHAMVSDALPHQVLPQGLPQDRISRVLSLPNWDTARQYQGGGQDQLDALLLSAQIADLKPDVIHVSHVFEGFGDRVALPAPSRRASGQILSATLYDLIPLRFQDHYFQSDEFRKWYWSRVSWLRKADLLLAISESSRQDAIEILGIEPWRITTIHGGIHSHFQPAVDRVARKSAIHKSFGLRRSYVLYTGGDDHRKNIGGAIAGYSQVASSLRRDCQLVIVCAMEPHRKEMYLQIAKQAGLAEGEVVITGFVSEDDLVGLYQCCDVFLFPSLYEGLGLPVLEAMACGAPAIGGNNSSVREIIAHSDAMFDAGSAQSIASAVTRVIQDKDFQAALREHGLIRSKEYSWARSAALALGAFEEAALRVQTAGVQGAVSCWLPKRRLAVLSPLPPCRSGIADYNAKFLPHLARHFEIDLFVDGYEVADETLTTAFKVRDVSKFPQLAQHYDAILYEFGNSEFHHHMLPLLEKFPGVVGLHDAYLSGMFGYLDFYLGDTGSYPIAMIGAHGPRARRYYAPVAQHPEPNGATMVELPCTKRVLDLATGVISHSPFNLDVANSNYPEGWPAPYRIIPQMVPLPPARNANAALAERKTLGFESDDIIIATFGHIAWTKWGDRLLEAFLTPALRDNHRLRLVFAGELSKDEFGKRLIETIEAAGLGSRIQVTGFLSEADYARFLRVADVAVQLRTKSRGGTPKGVLDCLANELPVLVNNDASYRDYPDNVVLKLMPDPTAVEIAEALHTLVADANAREMLAVNGRAYVSRQHDPELCAAQYAVAIGEFTDRSIRTQTQTLASAMAPLLADCKDASAATKVAAQAVATIRATGFVRRRLIVDVSHIARSDHETGIPRVMKRILRHLYCLDRAGIETVAVELAGGKLKIAYPWLESQGLLVAKERTLVGEDVYIDFRPGDIFLMLDSSWARYREFYPVFEEARKAAVPVVTAIYDLLPLTLPPGNIVDGGKEWFTGWFRDAIESSDALICISHAVARDVITIAPSICEKGKHANVGYWHLGADFANAVTDRNPSDRLINAVSKPYMLMVGTIEPRKSHSLALEAFEEMWAKGADLALCIAGKEGWMVGELMQRLRSHSLLGQKLFLVEGPTDDEISTLYSRCKGLLFLSKGEGFGLPLVEAAQYGVPIVCSNLPVFREVAGEFATYVTSDRAHDVARELSAWWKRCRAGKVPKTDSMPRLTWEQSAEALLKVVLEQNWIR